MDNFFKRRWKSFQALSKGTKANIIFLIGLVVLIVLCLFIPCVTVTNPENGENYKYSGLYLITRTLDIDFFHSQTEYNQPFPFILVIVTYPTLIWLILCLFNVICSIIKAIVGDDVRFMWELITLGFISIISTAIAFSVSVFSSSEVGKLLSNGFSLKFSFVLALYPLILIAISVCSKLFREKTIQENKYEEDFIDNYK